MALMPEKFRHDFIRSRLRLGDGASPHYIFKLAETRDELEQAFRVLHDAYVGQGYMDPHPSGLRVTKYHALPTTAVLITKDLRTNEVVATVSIVRNTALGLPLDSVFPINDIKKNIAIWRRFHRLRFEKSIEEIRVFCYGRYFGISTNIFATSCGWTPM